ncbi:MAG: RluA family pseudouridine synthase [Planctomycetota bacterium]|nr:MAG: RluA family pseudouridine synthase [Planctomycetota bacterium]
MASRLRRLAEASEFARAVVCVVGERRRDEGGEHGVADDEAYGLRCWEVGRDEGGRLDRFLAQRLEGLGHSRSSAKGWIAAGRVRVERARRGAASEPPRVVKAAFALRPGDEVWVDLPPPPPPPEPIRPEALDVPILYQDEEILVLDKPPALTVHPGAGQRQGTLVSALLAMSPGRLSRLGGPERPGIVHRLDRDTSGVIVVARTDRAHRALARQFHDRLVSKRYLALVCGVPRLSEGVVDAPIGRHPKDRKRMAVVPGGRPARTRYRVLETFARHALVECRPETGRTHQLRVHLKSLGTPIVADATYGRGNRFTQADAGLGGDEVLLSRQALHAERLEFEHPGRGERVAFRAPLPADIEGALAALRGAA